ncbi:MAG: accessory gene regulator B family protein [Ruminococcus sp.]|nr:accessory gene regulator B family protein [Ruminococcus sp.]
MFTRTAYKITEAMAVHGVISAERKTVCSWGMCHILDSLFNLAIFSVIGILCHMLPETAVFTVSYICLRVYAGGFHASTPVRCSVISDIVLIAALRDIRFAEQHTTAFVVCSAAAVTVILILMPVADIRKPLDGRDRRRYRRKGAVILSAEVIASVTLYAVGSGIYAAVAAAWQMLAAVLIVGCIKNCMKGGERRNDRKALEDRR